MKCRSQIINDLKKTTIMKKLVLAFTVILAFLFIGNADNNVFGNNQTQKPMKIKPKKESSQVGSSRGDYTGKKQNKGANGGKSKAKLKSQNRTKNTGFRR